tara:strand:+ start:208 stop:369 length:162 start_codon:yes stop_codon:yes gene_type:complete
MIFNYTWIWGLVFGLETSTMHLFDEGEEFDMEAPPSVVYSLHLGVITFDLIIR